MKSTLVIFAVPGGGYVSCPGEDLAVVPQQGVCYVLSGRLYEVEKTVESLGPQSGDAKLMELLSLAGDGSQSEAGAVPQIRNLGGPGAAGGLQSTPSRVLLVRLRLLKRTTTTIRIQVPSESKLHVGTDGHPSNTSSAQSGAARGIAPKPAPKREVDRDVRPRK